MKKSPLAAFFLSFLPGVGHAYAGRPVRAVLYGGAFFGSVGLMLSLGLIDVGVDGEVFLFFIFIAAMAGLLNMIDMVLFLLVGKGFPIYQAHQHPFEQSAVHYGPNLEQLKHEHEREKTQVILFSLIPGLGHMKIGLMQRGITLLISFIGWFAIIVFLGLIIHRGELLVFLLALPFIWVYSMFDAISQLQAKQRGEPLVDRAIFEDMEAYISSGRKSKVLAIALAIFPGAGHLYLGLQKRGLQLMGGFLLAIFIMDNLRLSLFFFLLPLFWCFAFFDALQQTSRYDRQELTDEPVVTQLVPYQRWFGFGLLGFGVYYLLDRVLAAITSHLSNELYNQYMQFKYMIPTAVIAFIMIIVGMRLAFGTKTTKKG